VSTLAKKLSELARKARARAAIDQARRQLAKPENRRRLEQLGARLDRKR
jgi:hypothetical protein